MGLEHDSKGKGRRMIDRTTGEEIRPFGYDLDSKGTPIKVYVDLSRVGDHGADPIGNGQFRMVPSGDIVSASERDRRLAL